jgi:myo-inositol-1(or 4)-monophosphatase
MDLEMKYLVNNEKFLYSVVDVIKETKQIIDRTRIEQMKVTKKGQGNYVTQFDKEIESFLVTGLGKLLPDAGYIAEESRYKSGKGLNWIIDPIDGTGNFINGFEYSVSVALQSNEETILGVVYVPLEETVYFGISGTGAFKQDETGKVEEIKVREFSDDSGIVIFGLPYDRKKTEKIFDMAQKMYTIASDMKRMGPSSLDICRIAEGKGKLYFELDLELWDIAAGELILREAGGELCVIENLYLFGSEKAIKSAKDTIFP